MFLIYQLLLSLALVFSPLIIIYRLFKNKEHETRFVEKFSFNNKKRINGKLIWFHGASVGEILSIIPIVKYYEKHKKIKQILVTSSTLSSAKVFEKFKFKKAVHQFYPIDYHFINKKFLNFWKPNLAIFIESEIWPCMFNLLDKKKIPLVLLNARITNKTYKKWSKLKKFSKSVFGKINVSFPQNKETKYYLNKLKLKKVKELGNLKFAENSSNHLDKIPKYLKREFNKKKVWVASSTHKDEEIFCAETHLKLKKKISNLVTIIIPRHVHRVNEISDKIKSMNLVVKIHSLKPKNLSNVDIYIVDTFGETKKFHEIASSVFLGGSIINRGGQNPLEAARCGAKIFHGPNTDNFKDIYKLLNTLKISYKINSPERLAKLITFKKNKNIANKIKLIGNTILKKTLNELNLLIKNEF